MNTATANKLEIHHEECGSHEYVKDKDQNKPAYVCKKCGVKIKIVED